jgi:hypothetical protein
VIAAIRTDRPVCAQRREQLPLLHGDCNHRDHLKDNRRATHQAVCPREPHPSCPAVRHRVPHQTMTTPARSRLTARGTLTRWRLTAGAAAATKAGKSRCRPINVRRILWATKGNGHELIRWGLPDPFA